MRKLFISLILSVVSMGIYANDAFHLNDEQLQNVKKYICVAITKYAMSNAQANTDRMSYNDVFSNIGENDIDNSGFEEFKEKIEGPQGSNWSQTKKDIWNPICQMTDSCNRLEDLLSGLDDEKYKNCRPEDVKSQVNKYHNRLEEHKRIKTQYSNEGSSHRNEKKNIQEKARKEYYAGEEKTMNTGFSMFQMILACFISFVGGMIICIIGNLSQKVSLNKHYNHNTSHSFYDIDSNKQRNEKQKENSDSKEIDNHKDQKNRKAEVSHNQSEFPKTKTNSVEDSKEEKHNNEDQELNKKSDSNDNKEKNQESVTNVVDIDNLNPDEVCNSDSELEKNEKIVLKYLRKLKDDSFSKISPNIEDDSYFAFNEKTFELTVVEDNVESALYYADDILTTNVVEIESRVSNPKRIEMLAPGKVEYVGGGWKVIKKVRIKLI